MGEWEREELLSFLLSSPPIFSSKASQRLPSSISNLIEGHATIPLDSYGTWMVSVDSILIALNIEMSIIVYWLVAGIVASNYDRLPEDVRNELQDSITSYYYKLLPEDSGIMLLLKLADNKETFFYVSCALAENYYMLPEDVRNELLLKLADNVERSEKILAGLIAGKIAGIVAHEYEKLPDNLRKLLFKLADNNETASSLASAIARNYNLLAEDVRNDLVRRLRTSLLNS